MELEITQIPNIEVIEIEISEEGLDIYKYLDNILFGYLFNLIFLFIILSYLFKPYKYYFSIIIQSLIRFI